MSDSKKIPKACRLNLPAVMGRPSGWPWKRLSPATHNSIAGGNDLPPAHRLGGSPGVSSTGERIFFFAGGKPYNYKLFSTSDTYNWSHDQV
jgi:hypothetical protein